jgi:hypothetical protein
MARLHDVVFDCAHPASVARFWAAALDGYEIAPYDEAELERLRQQGIDDPEDDPTVLVEAHGTAPRLWFQLVPEGKVAKNRVHLDLATDDPDHEIPRLQQLGATVLDHQPNDGLVVMMDPEGNEFCVLK